VARLVVLDPDLLAGSPKEVIAASGLDAFTQALEAFVSRKATGFTDTLSLEGLRLVSRSIEAVYEGAAGDAARDLLYGSYLAGMALSNARLGIVHGLAHPLGARYGIPHGAVCGVCLPHAIEFNREAAAEKYARAADAIGTHPLDRILHLLNALGVRSPFAGRPVLDRAGIVEETLASGSTAANPRPVKAADVEELLDRIFAG
jgi:alcohol dehydrogenase class IV